MTTLTTPPITKRQLQILELLYIYRFLSRPQIQAFFKHKNATRTNLWLKDLTEKDYLYCIYERTRDAAPAVYYAGLGAIRHFRTQDYGPKYVQAMYQDHTRSKAYIDSRLLLADIALELIGKESENVRYIFATKPVFTRRDSKARFLNDFPVQPDAILIHNLVGQFSGATIQIFLATSPPYLFNMAISFYLELYFSSKWENQMHLRFPQVLLVVPPRMKRHAQEYIQYRLKQQNVPPGEITFTIVTHKQIQTQGLATYLEPKREPGTSN